MERSHSFWTLLLLLRDEWLERSYAILYRVKEDMNLPIVHVVKYLVFDLHVGMLIRDIRLEDF
jgi:hypothetical protein